MTREKGREGGGERERDVVGDGETGWLEREREMLRGIGGRVMGMGGI